MATRLAPAEIVHDEGVHADAANHVVLAEVVLPTRRLSSWRRMVTWSVSILVTSLEWLVGFASMICGLSLLATVPILQFVSLGYLLTISVRVQKSGRFRDAFRDIPAWANAGGALLATWMILLPLRLLADLQYSATLLENDAARGNLEGAIGILGALACVHVSWAFYRGGRWRHFLWPAPRRLWRTIRSGGLFARARDRTIGWLARLEIGSHLWLGMRGFVVAIGWLTIPVSLMVVASRLAEGPAFLLSLLGGILLAAVVTYLPLAQLNFAVDDRIRSGFDRRRIHHQFTRAPLAFLIGLVATLTLALPLYLLKAELIPREATWLPSIVFVVSVLPARLLIGWAAHRAALRDVPRHWIFRYASRLILVPITIVYALFVYLTQYVSWYGAYSLYEQHAFLLPVPFLGG